MKPYCVAGHDQFTVATWLALIGVAASAMLSYSAVPLLFMDFPTPFVSFKNLVQVCATGLTIAAILHLGLNKCFWKLGWVRHFLGIPNLNGNWIGTIDRTEYPSLKKEKDLPVLVRVKQDYRRMQIILENYDKNSLSGFTSSEAHSINIDGHAQSRCTIHHMFDFAQGSGASSLTYSQAFKHAELRGTYVSNFPRTGTVTLRQLDKEDSVHRLPVKILKDNTGAEYLGIVIEDDFLKPYLKKLKKKSGTYDLTKAAANRKLRDGTSHHLTIVSPPELTKKRAALLKAFQDRDILFALTGLGSVNKNGATAYYVTVHSPHGALLRREANLPPRDFHVTLGFDPQDIHGVPKDESTWI
jgi:hypothetical protein